MFRDFQTNTTLDAYAYYDRFNLATGSLFEFIQVSNFEIGYSVLAWLVKKVFNSFVVFLAIVHLFVFFVTCYFIRQIKWGKYKFLPTLAINLNLFVVYYLQRNIIAVSFGLLMILALINKKYIKALIFLALAVLFHSSALILFALCAFAILLDLKYYFTKAKFIALSIMMFLLVLLAVKLLPYIMAASGKYFVYKNEGSFSLATDLIAVVILLLYLYNMETTNANYKSAKIMGMAIVSLLLVIPLQAEYGIMYRMMMFFLPITYVLPLYILYSCKNSTVRFFIKIFIFVYYVYRFYSFFAGETVYIGLPYRFGF